MIFLDGVENETRPPLWVRSWAQALRRPRSCCSGNLQVVPCLRLEHPENGCRTSSTNYNWEKTATAGSDVVRSGRPIFDDFFQHLWPYIGNNTANVVFQMVKRLWLIRIDQ
ncbi:hypothetical protein TNCV_357271 [Trichonephila clavipes]|nr:hypothetical protein TNCV_357271 [Trichonephila clavipes]